MEFMKFDQFTDAVVEKIREYLPETFRNAAVELQTVTKNNNLRLTGLTIRSIDSNISPTIYLESFYDNYKEGEKIEDVLEKIAQVRIEHEVSESFDIEKITDFDAIKDLVTPKIINKGWNNDLLSQRPHKDIADLSIIYQIMLKQGFDGNASIPITYQLMDLWKTDVDTLHEMALHNMTILTPSTLEPISTVLASMVDEETAALFENGAPDGELMWVLSNKQRINGATAILDRTIMGRVEEILGPDFILIPSSTCEFLAIPSTTETDTDSIRQMIKDVNSEMVAADEKLSDHPYKYYQHSLVCM